MTAITGATTTTSLTELIQSEFINQFIASCCGNYKNPSQFFLPININNGASTVSQPRWVSDVGTVPDDGVAVATAFDATEATDLVANELETTDSTFNVVEYGLLREPSDTALEDASIITIQDIVSNATGIILDAMNDDACALFASFVASKGSTGVDCRISDVNDVLYDLARRGVMGEAVGVFDNQAVDDFYAALEATSTSMAVYAGTVDRLYNVQNDPMQGRNPQGFTLRYKGVDIYRQGLTDTANAGADVVSGVFVRGDMPAQRESAAIGQASRRSFRLETQRDASARCTEFVFTARWGCGFINNQMGCKLVTDA
jgi:hypothetical protein